MSDTKWFKLLALLCDSELGVMTCLWKIVDVEEPFSCRLGVFASTGLDLQGVVLYREIEWFLIPELVDVSVRHAGAVLRAKSARHDLVNLESAIRKLGRYPIEVVPEGIKIVAYTRKS